MMWLVYAFWVIGKIFASSSTTVELMVGYNKVSFAGETCPNCLVYIREGDSILGTTLAAADGKFSYYLEYLWEGDHSFLLSTTDSLLTSSNGVTYKVSVAKDTIVKIDNIILLPTVSFPSQVSQNENLIVGGYTISNGDVVVEVLGKNEYWSGKADNFGRWQISVPTLNWVAGGYNFRVKVVNESGSESGWGLLNTFSVVEAVFTPTNTEVVVNTDNNQRSESLKVADQITAGDEPTVNKSFKTKTYVKNEEKSTILQQLPKAGFYDPGQSKRIYDLWFKAYVVEKGQNVCDLNNDLVCDIYDFSILMYLLR